jgi:hypothetical protein
VNVVELPCPMLGCGRPPFLLESGLGSHLAHRHRLPCPDVADAIEASYAMSFFRRLGSALCECGCRAVEHVEPDETGGLCLRCECPSFRRA